MKGKSLIAENREMAFQVYCAQGGNVEATLRELASGRSTGSPLQLSKPTFYEWMDKYNFRARMDEIDRKKQESRDQAATFEESMLAALMTQKTAYETYFTTLTTPDHQAQYAYAGIIKTLLDVRQKMSSFKSLLFLDFMKDMILFLGKNDPDAVPVIENNFDDFIQFAKEKYGA